MVRIFDSLFPTQVATSQLRSWLVFAVFLAPFQLVMTATTTVQNRRFQNLFRLFRLRIVLKGKGVLMGWSPTLLLLLCAVTWLLWHAIVS